jgi:ankyrin repeat protein
MLTTICGSHQASISSASGHTVNVKLPPDRPNNNPDLVMEVVGSSLMLAATRSDFEIVQLLLDRGGIGFNRQDVLGHTALGKAARYGCFENVKLLLG